ncbi:hypothetical protein G3N55_00140 [Dissulfurirhabdus thermomarina]|uniref:Bacteriophage Mu GpT domain-containing protein n=1 Tax=Dissulfurirhabdus thermomarina TaxID=1765737 RepID=A0A6N9TJK2_DISTH|nr:prohead protease/major capsid protein fusion protein [Dissulfurirhabdus thermomarina]NDY41259.1 hypothetical protein [Dissulfurirhabdus thermomarina]
MRRRQIAQRLEEAGLAPGMTTRAAGMRMAPESWDPEARSVRAVAATEQPATVWDWERMDFVDEVLRVDGLILPPSGQVPLLDAHSRGSVADVLGSAADFRRTTADGQPAVECRLDLSSAAADAATKISEGHLTDVSVGYAVREAVYIPAGQRQVVGGREYEGPLKVSTRWELRELSLVPIGADRLAKVRAAIKEDDDMNEHLRAFLEARGLAADATEEQALDYMRRLAEENDEARAEIERLKAQQADPEAVRAEERRRIREITEAVSVAGLPDELARELIDAGTDLNQARARIIDELKRRGPAIGAGAGRVEPGLDERDKFRAAARDGLLLRAGGQVDRPAPGAREFRGVTLLDLAREALVRAGVQVRGLNRLQLATRALNPASGSDFPALMADVANKRLVQAYTEWPATWRPFVAVTDASDFKELHSIRLSGSPDLLDVGENGEYQTASFADATEKYRVVTKGRIVRLTRQMLINDDLWAFARIPQLFGTAARRMEAAAVYSLITGNPVMSDGNALFSTAHKNLASTGAAISSASLSAARAAMRKQVGLNKERLDIQPAFLLVPVEKETDAEVLLRSAALPEDAKSAGVYNPWAGRLTPIADPALDDVSTKAWYLIARPDQVPTIEVAYLMGEQQPYVDEEPDFDSDALKIKVRHDFGAGLVDWVGIYKNPGA